jgi:hypothetical protein
MCSDCQPRLTALRGRARELPERAQQRLDLGARREDAAELEEVPARLTVQEDAVQTGDAEVLGPGVQRERGRGMVRVALEDRADLGRRPVGCLAHPHRLDGGAAHRRAASWKSAAKRSKSGCRTGSKERPGTCRCCRRCPGLSRLRPARDGAGTWADNETGAVSGTGLGEVFIRAVARHDVAARMRYGSRTLAKPPMPS